MKRYPLYKDSKVKWIGNVPEHWKWQPLNSIASIKSQCGFVDEVLLSVYLDRGVVRFSDIKEKRTNTTSLDLSKYQLVEIGDFVLNNQQAWRGSVGVSSYKGIVSPAYYVLKLTDDLLPFYANYLLRSPEMVAGYYIASKGIGSIQRNLDWNKAKRYYVLIPTLDEQRAIVAFLDRAVEKIDGYIAAKEAEIEKLGTLKQSVIAKAVTQGLNPDVPMKDSGIDWLDMIPTHWNIHLIKQHFRIQKRIAGKEGYKVLSITQSGLRVKDISCNEGQMAANYSGYQFVYPGDFAMNHMDLITGGVGLSTEFGVTSPDYRVFELYDKKTCNPDYFLYIFQICYKRRIFYRYGRGAASVGRWRLPAKEFLNFTIPVPPIEEQRKIVDYISRKTQEIDGFITGIRAQIEKLKVYKQRLISDVVTGKICVCDDFLEAN